MLGAGNCKDLVATDEDPVPCSPGTQCQHPSLQKLGWQGVEAPDGHQPELKE